MHLDIHGALTKKIGPLPGGVWAGIGVLGIVAYVHFHKSSTSPGAATTTDPGTTALQTGGGLLGGGGGGGGGSTPSDSGGSAGTFTDPAPGGTDPTPVFVPIPDPSSTVFPDPTSTPNDTEPVAVLAPTQTLNVSSRGALLGTVQAPILPISTPASELYKAVGLKASDPFTLTPQAAPQDATQAMEQAQGQEIRAAQAQAAATHTAVAV